MGGNHRNYLDIPIEQIRGDISGGTLGPEFKKLAEVVPEVVDIVVKSLMRSSYVVRRKKTGGLIELYGWKPDDDDDE